MPAVDTFDFSSFEKFQGEECAQYSRATKSHSDFKAFNVASCHMLPYSKSMSLVFESEYKTGLLESFIPTSIARKAFLLQPAFQSDKMFKSWHSMTHSTPAG